MDGTRDSSPEVFGSFGFPKSEARLSFPSSLDLEREDDLPGLRFGVDPDHSSASYGTEADLPTHPPPPPSTMVTEESPLPFVLRRHPSKSDRSVRIQVTPDGDESAATQVEPSLTRAPVAAERQYASECEGEAAEAVFELLDAIAAPDDPRPALVPSPSTRSEPAREAAAREPRRVVIGDATSMVEPAAEELTGALPGKLRTTLSGLVVGAGWAALSLYSLVRGTGIELARRLGEITVAALMPTQVGGYLVAALAGAALGIVAALLTRHVARKLPLLLFGLLFAPASALVLYALVLPKLVPQLQAMFPIGALLPAVALWALMPVAVAVLRGGSR